MESKVSNNQGLTTGQDEGIAKEKFISSRSISFDPTKNQKEAQYPKAPSGKTIFKIRFGRRHF